MGFGDYVLVIVCSMIIVTMAIGGMLALTSGIENLIKKFRNKDDDSDDYTPRGPTIVA